MGEGLSRGGIEDFGIGLLEGLLSKHVRLPDPVLEHFPTSDYDRTIKTELELFGQKMGYSINFVAFTVLITLGLSYSAG